MTEKFKLVPVEPDDTMVEATFAGMLETRDVPGQMKRRAEMRRRIALAIAAAPEAPAAEPVAFEMDWPDFHAEAMGCGLEDRNITDRYEAMRYGWDEAIERCAERLPNGLYIGNVATPSDPVAVIGDGFNIFWVGSGPIAPIIEKHSLKVGDNLYALPPDAAAIITGLESRIESQGELLLNKEAENTELRANLAAKDAEIEAVWRLPEAQEKEIDELTAERDHWHDMYNGSIGNGVA